MEGGPVGQHQQLISEDGSAAPTAGQGGLQLGFVAGVILRERLPAFERMLWRACRGNVFLRQAEIEDPLEDPQLGGDEVFKSVFIIFFQGEHLKVGTLRYPLAAFRGGGVTRSQSFTECEM